MVNKSSLERALGGGAVTMVIKHSFSTDSEKLTGKPEQTLQLFSLTLFL